MKKSIGPLVYSFIFMSGFSAFLQTTQGFYSQILFPYTIFSLTLALSAIHFFYGKKINIRFSQFIGFYLIPLFISFVVLPVSVLTGNNLNYDELSFGGRLFNILLFSSLIVTIYSVSTDRTILLKGYYWGCLVLLLTGLWQVLSAYSSIPFPFDTRAHIHSTYGQDFSFVQRMTGVSQEPSYFVMFAIDLFALSLFFDRGVKQKMVLCLSILCVLFSIAPSGILTFVLAVFCAVFFTFFKFLDYRISFKNLLSGVFIIAFLLFSILMFVDSEIFSYFLTRILNLDIENSPRLYESIMPFIWSLDSNVVNFIFGHGVKSYSLLADFYPGPNGAVMHATSNNIYVDIFWESGFIGLSLLLIFYGYLFFKVQSNWLSKKQTFIAFFVLFDVIFSGFFRADFASFRYFILLYFIFIVINYDLRKVRGINV